MRSPIKGLVKRKNTPSIKKILFLIDIDGFLKSPSSWAGFWTQKISCTAIDSKLKSRLFRNPSTLYRLQPGLTFLPVTRPLFSFCRFTVRLRIRISHPSGSRRLCFTPMASKHGPWSSWTPKILRYHTVFNWMGYKSCGFSQPLMDSRYRRIRF